MDKEVIVEIRTMLLMLHGLHNKPHNQHSSLADTLTQFLNINQIIFYLECTTKQCSSREINSNPCSEHVEGNAWMWFLKKKSLSPKGRGRAGTVKTFPLSVRHHLDLQFEYNRLLVTRKCRKTVAKAIAPRPAFQTKAILTSLQSHTGGKRGKENNQANQTITHHLCSSRSQ